MTQLHKSKGGRPLQGDRRKRPVTITISDDDADYARRIGVGNLSGGLAELIRLHRKRAGPK